MTTKFTRNIISFTLSALIFIVSLSDFKVTAFELAIMVLAVAVTLFSNALIRPHMKK